MTGRQRILTVFGHGCPDRVPFFEQGVASRVAGDVLGRPALTGGGTFRFQASLAGYRGPDAWAEFQQRYLRDYVALARALEFDMVSLPWTGPGRPSRRLDERTFRFENPTLGTWTVHRFDPVTDTFQQIDSIFRREGLEAVERCVHRLADRPAGQSDEEEPGQPLTVGLRYVLDHLGPGNPHGVRCAVAAGPGIAVPMEEPWLEAMLLRPDLVETYLDVQLERALASIDRLAAAGVDVVWGGGDLADNRGPVYSPAAFGRFLLPRLQKTTARCHRHGLPYVFRSDGWLWPIAQELFAESGVDGYGEIDAQAGMTLTDLKARYPRLTLWGNVDCAGALVRGTAEEVAAETRRCLEVGAPGGHYILGSSNVIHAEVKTENFLEMVAALQQYGCY